MTHIYILPLHSNINIDEHIRKLPSWRREQALGFKHKQGQMECTLSYLLLCRALQDVYGIDEQPYFIVGEHGKPSLQQFPHVHFNMSHCREAVAVAVSDEPVGIDIERIGRYRESVARYAFSDEELHAIATSENKQEAFTRLWTRKEAIVKLTGEGITHNLKTLLTDASLMSASPSDQNTSPFNLHTYTLAHLSCFLSIAQSVSSPPSSPVILTPQEL